MTLKPRLGIAGGAVALALIATAAAAQSQAASASMEVLDSLTITTIQQMRFDSPGPPAAGDVSSTLANAPAVIQVSGGADRAYRITLPPSLQTSQAGAVVENLTAWSANVGDISVSRSGRMDSDGRDTLQVGGRLRLIGVRTRGPIVASVSLRVDYQ
jgi:hypothetical protein